MSVSSVHTGGQSLPPSVCFSWKPATATASEGPGALWVPGFAVNLIATPRWRWGRAGALVIIYSARSSWVVAQGVCQRLCEKPVAGGLGSSLQASLLQISFLLRGPENAACLYWLVIEAPHHRFLSSPLCLSSLRGFERNDRFWDTCRNPGTRRGPWAMLIPAGAGILLSPGPGISGKIC